MGTCTKITSIVTVPLHNKSAQLQVEEKQRIYGER